MRKFYKIMAVTLLLALTPIPGSLLFAGDAPETAAGFGGEALEISSPGEIPARASLLMEANGGKILYESNSHEKMPPASITKIMTMLLAMEALDAGKISLDDMATCSEHANSIGGKQIWLEVGEQMSVRDLLKAVSIASANDASVMLGEYIAGSEAAFVDMMNKRAAELGMKDSAFTNASGLDDDGQFSSACDIAIMSRELLRHPLIKDYSTIWMDTLRGGETSLVNTNRLVRFYEGATGLKTGTTANAGKCLSASAERGGLELIAVVLGSSTSDERFNSAKRLLDYGFANWELSEFPPLGEELSPVPVLKGVEPEVSVELSESAPIVIQKGRKDDIERKVELAESLEAPVEKGQVIGKVSLCLDGAEVASYPLKAASAIAKMNFFKAFAKLVATALDFS
ncbi:MAG: D-alanyl-D-alanine carboxypeptidase [Oscillospiraceae bacterium]|jgi:D-alanyl-D-alanine carboxypeptidase (penicillin-binding protein 5/6)|nr:D-alanyl-D-alanine carboxypeptidase [Oscillospiraceae bacterium]